MMTGVVHLLMVVAVVSTMTVTQWSVDAQSWRELERLDVCSSVDNPSVAETCSLCPAALPGVSVWRCCHDPRAFDSCAAAVDQAVADQEDSGGVDKRRTKFFLGKKSGTKFFLGRRSLGDATGNYDRSQAAADKRVKYFLG